MPWTRISPKLAIGSCLQRRGDEPSCGRRTNATAHPLTLGLDRHQLSATPEGGRPGFLASEAGAFFPGQMIAVNGAGQT